MTYAAAKAQVIARIEAISPRNVGQGFGSQFVHVPEAEEDNAPGARGFWLEALGGSRLGPYTTGRNRMQRELELSVLYRHALSRDFRDTVMADDHTDIVLQLLDTSQWDSSNTGIVDIGASPLLDEQDELFPASVEVLDNGDRMLRIRFFLTHLDDIS